MSRNEAIYAEVRRQEVVRVQEGKHERLVAQMKAVAQTAEGRELLDWIIYDAGGLMKIVDAQDEGRRRLASAVYNLLDRALPGVGEEIALEARRRREEYDTDIAQAILKRSDEYGG